MAWITHKPVTYTTTSTDAEIATIFAGSGATNNAEFRVTEPSGSDFRAWWVEASLDGTNFSPSTTPVSIVSILPTNTETLEGIMPVGFTAPYYRVSVFTNATPKTFTITFSEEI